jgi:hypothetical protein
MKAKTTTVYSVVRAESYYLHAIDKPFKTLKAANAMRDEVNAFVIENEGKNSPRAVVKSRTVKA